MDHHLAHLLPKSQHAGLDPAHVGCQAAHVGLGLDRQDCTDAVGRGCPAHVGWVAAHVAAGRLEGHIHQAAPSCGAAGLRRILGEVHVVCHKERHVEAVHTLPLSTAWG